MTSYRKSMKEALAEVRLDEAKMKPAQVAALKKAYEPMRGKKISMANADKLRAMMDKFGKDKDTLIQLFKADIPFISQSAMTQLISKHGMKGAEINKLREEFNVESVDIDEGKVTKKERDRLEDENQHGELALKLAQAYGTPEEVKKIKEINKRHEKRGSIERKDQQERDKISNKYYKMAEEVDLDEGYQVYVKSPTAKSGWIPQGQPHKSEADAKKDAKNFRGATKVVKEALSQLVKADIPFVSQLAVTRLITKHGMKGAEIRKMQEEVELDEAKYDLYHKDFSSAMQHAYKMAKKLHGITVDPKEIDDKVASGPRKPSEGKTNSYRLKGDKGAIQVQVYNKGGSKPFELNMYKEEVELDEVARSPYTGAVVTGPKDSKKEKEHHAKMRAKERKKELDEGKMKELHGYISQGKSAEEIAKKMKLDVDTIKTLMAAYESEDKKYSKMLAAACNGGGSMAATQASYDPKLDEAKRDVDPADVDTSATDDDVKAADKNIMMQLRKSVSLRGQHPVEFLDKKKVKIPQKIAQAVLDKFNKMKKPADKEKFQAKVAKSHKDLLNALKEETVMSKYLEIKKDSLEESILGVWASAAEKMESIKENPDGRTKVYKSHRTKLVLRLC